jgi:hypothetical protein
MASIYEYAAEMGSGAMIYIPSSGIQKLMEWDTQTHKPEGNRKSLL